MLDKILAAYAPFPPYLHRHILQLYVIKHRRAPSSEVERRRAVYEYLTRTRHDKSGLTRIHSSPELQAWLEEADDRERGWGPMPRLAGLVHQFSGELRKRYDLGVERDYKEFACYVALSVQGVLRWPEELVGQTLRNVLWEAAPGIHSESRIGVTRALNHVRRNAPRVRQLNLSRPADLSQLLLSVLSDIDEGKLPAYALSPAQYGYLAQPVKLGHSKLRITGLLHHLIVERGLVKERDFSRPEVVETVRRETPGLLARLRLPGPLRAAHEAYLAPVTPIASRATADQPVPVVTVVGPVGHGSGLGAAARACLEAFKTAAVPVEVLNLKASWGRNDEGEDGSFTAHVRGDINIIHFNPDVIIENLSRFGFEQFEGRYNIGFFFWETSRASLAHRLGADLVDEVWVSSEYCREVFAQVTDKPVVVVATPVPKIGDLSWATRSCFGIPDGKFCFVYTFDGASRFTRKNPDGAVRAFQKAFPADDGVRLVLKTQNTEWLSAADERIYAEIRRQARKDRRIIVIDESFSSNEVHGLISVCDCYVALHRSEGFGFGMAEAMKLRVPVIATGYSGNADFTTEETAYPVRYRLVPVPKHEFVYEDAGQEWAEPDIDHAAARMLEVRTDPNRASKVDRACRFIEANYGQDIVGRAYRQRIEAIRSGFRAEALVANAGAR
jgi:glycosyltransferase involved in cell wall biosynthesis